MMPRRTRRQSARSTRSPSAGQTVRNWRASEAHALEVQWSEVRVNRDGRSERFFVCGTRTPAGWLFEERSTWEVSWYPVGAHLQPRCSKRAAEVLREAAVPAGQINRQPPEVGNFHDNCAVVMQARAKLAAGDEDDAVYWLTFLRDHILASPDPKNESLLPQIREILEEAAAIESEGTAAENVGPRHDRAARGGHSVEQLKAHLLDACVLVATFGYAMGLLAHEVMAVLPSLAGSPIATNVIAASVLGITLLVIRSHSG